VANISELTTAGAVLARIVAVGPDGEPWIAVGDLGAEPRRAETVVPIDPSVVGRRVLVSFAGAERTPVVVGVVVEAGDQAASFSAPLVDLVIDRRRIVLSAQQEVVLRCGAASITLTADGRAVVRGADVVSSATRTNRVRGGAVKIN
jgi:hypothetical protein